MKSNEQDPSVLRQLLSYNPLTGELKWIKSTNRRIRVGDVAGSGADRLRIRVNGVCYLRSRLAWCLHYGMWPDGVVDHMDGVKTNDNISNLRDVPQLVNVQNQLRSHKRSKSGLLGVSPSHNGKFDAYIMANGKSKYLGRRASAQEAHQLYLSAKSQLHPSSCISINKGV